MSVMRRVDFFIFINIWQGDKYDMRVRISLWSHCLRCISRPICIIGELFYYLLLALSKT
uniref:Uncharacterized protein n=1 Tax=Kalanchoe fedtschenkoi TaxID=63787 RepID=A0A7N0T8S8_KALFE